MFKYTVKWLKSQCKSVVERLARFLSATFEYQVYPTPIGAQSVQPRNIIYTTVFIAHCDAICMTCLGKILPGQRITIAGGPSHADCAIRAQHIHQPETKSDVFSRCPNCGGLSIQGVCVKCRFKTVCCGCNRLKQPDEYWMGFHDRDVEDKNTSHGLCPDCLKKMYGHIIKSRLRFRGVGHGARQSGWKAVRHG